jgi:hypothetical protein
MATGWRARTGPKQVKSGKLKVKSKSESESESKRQN